MSVPYILETVVVGQLEVNCYLLADAITLECAVIDPGDEGKKIIARINELKLKPVAIINTHSHADHIGADADIKNEFNVPIMIHREDAPNLPEPEKNLSTYAGGAFSAPKADRLLEDGDTITIGSLVLRVTHVPGHSRGCIVLSVEDLLFTGDTLFCGTVGRTDLPGGSDTELYLSLKKFNSFPRKMRLLPGHEQSCSLEKEYGHNIFLGRP
jgi:hydroxyacylglutathione hydrolase